MTDIDIFIDKGYAYSVDYENEKDKDIKLFFSTFKKTEQKRKDMTYMFKIYECKLEYFNNEGLRIVNKIKCVGIVEFNKKEKSFNNSIFQIVDRQAFFFKQDFTALGDLYNKFLEDTEEDNTTDTSLMN